MVKLTVGTVVLLSLCLGLMFGACQPVAAARGGGGKKETPTDTVKRVVTEAIGGNKRVGAALIRLVFHDCWVNGCDGSVLLDSTSTNKAEKEAKNNIGLDGFGVIDRIKSELVSPGTVSCADIVVLAAREAAFNLSRGNIDYTVKTGRKDGVVSSADAADAVLPLSTFNITQLKDNFAKKGFNTKELVALSGAHAVGVAHLSSFADRLNDATATPINANYSKALSDDVVANPIEPNNIRDMDQNFRDASIYDAAGVDTTAKGVLDNSYYHANLQNTVLFRSDWELRNDTTGEAGSNMTAFKANAQAWFKQFELAMVKLSELPGGGSQIRTQCSKIN